MKPVRYNRDDGPLSGARIQHDVSSTYANFYDGTDWQKIVEEFTTTATGFILDAAPSKSFLPLLSTGEMMIEDKHRWDFNNRGILPEEDTISKAKMFKDAVAVTGVNLGKSILYQDALPSIDASIEIESIRTGLKYKTRWDAKPQICIDDPNATILVRYKERSPQGTFKKKNGQNIGNANGVLKGLKVTKGANRGLYTNPAELWDSNGKIQHVPIVGKMNKNWLHAHKEVPCSFFTDEVVYPVWTDTDNEVTPHATDGTASPDDGGGSAWATVRADNGDESFSTGVDTTAYGASNSWNRIRTGKVTWDTTGLTAATEGTVRMNADVIANGHGADADAESNLHLVNHSGAAESIGNTDYQNRGSTIWGEATELQEDVTVDVPYTIAVNAAFLAAIVDGNTVMGFRNGWDLNNTEPTTSGNTTQGIFYDASEDGSAKEPLLTLVTAGGGSPPATKMPIPQFGWLQEDLLEIAFA